MPKKTFAADLVADVHRRKAAGQTVRAIARAVAVPRSTVTAVLRDSRTMVQASMVKTPTPPHPRLILHPWLRLPAPLPGDLAMHPTVRRLYNDALAADPVRASELDILAVAFDLPVPRTRGYLNAVAGEALRTRFDLVQDEDRERDADGASLPTVDADSGPEPRPGRLTLPVGLWRAALGRLRAAFDAQERQLTAVRDRLLAVLPRDVAPDD